MNIFGLSILIYPVKSINGSHGFQNSKSVLKQEDLLEEKWSSSEVPLCLWCWNDTNRCLWYFPFTDLGVGPVMLPDASHQARAVQVPLVHRR